MKYTLFVCSLIVLFFTFQQCKTPLEKAAQLERLHKKKSSKLRKTHKSEERKNSTYYMVNPIQWMKEHEMDTMYQQIAFAINRTNRNNFLHMDSVLVPTDFKNNLADYLPFPLEVNYLKDIDKIVFFSYPTQTFAAYEKGLLIYTGPTNMGRKKHLTPTGLFFTNWKARITVSTVNDKWILKWNFNILNKAGIGWHQYNLPGYPASNSCLRLSEKDARYLYQWADQWVLADKYTVEVKGTPVIIFGSYDFSLPKPWFKLVTNSRALDISSDAIEKLTQPYLIEILRAQKNRDTILNIVAK